MENILVLSDLHVGSLYGVAGDVVTQFIGTSLSKLLNRKWMEMVERFREEKFDVLILNGDIVDGVGSATSGKEAWTTDVDKQIDEAEKLVSLLNFDKLVITYGSPYHTGENLNADQVFAKRIGANVHGYEVLLDVGGGERFHCSHNVGVSTAGMMYRTTPIAKELMLALLNEKVFGHVAGIIRSHAHYFVFVRFTDFGLITPAWQGRTPYMVRKGLGLVPKMGYVTISRRENEPGWSVRAFTFDAPLEAVKL